MWTWYLELHRICSCPWTRRDTEADFVWPYPVFHQAAWWDLFLLTRPRSDSNRDRCVRGKGKVCAEHYFYYRLSCSVMLCNLELPLIREFLWKWLCATIVTQKGCCLPEKRRLFASLNQVTIFVYNHHRLNVCSNGREDLHFGDSTWGHH